MQRITISGNHFCRQAVDVVARLLSSFVQAPRHELVCIVACGLYATMIQVVDLLYRQQYPGLIVVGNGRLRVR